VPPGSIAPQTLVLLLTALAPDAEGGHRAGLEALHTDVVSALLADAEVPFLNSIEGLLDLTDELAFPVPETQRKGTVRFMGSSIGRVGEVLRIAGHVVEGLPAFLLDIFEQFLQVGTKEFQILLFHAKILLHCHAEQRKEVFLTKTGQKVKWFSEILFQVINRVVDSGSWHAPAPVLDRISGLA
jgi:hypothetical protein